ncbi:hypothetical protein OAB00_04305 [Akkermansiaceae bacterium]|nr:hypothetical protein [Akkermansiaceae bacterium]
MICIAGKLPILQVGRHQVCGYKTSWILEGLETAANKAGMTEFPFLEDLYIAIKQYLEVECSLEVLPIEQLNERIVKMLEKIGLTKLTEELPMLAPPIVLSLEWIAKKSGPGFELGFFTSLKEEIYSARKAGVTKLILEELKPAVSIVRGNKKWDKKCVTLMEEIVGFISESGMETPQAYSEQRLIVPMPRRDIFTDI